MKKNCTGGLAIAGICAVAIILPGCTQLFGPQSYLPIRLRDSWISEGAPSAEDAASGVEGFIHVCVAEIDDNARAHHFGEGIDFYQVSPTGNLNWVDGWHHNESIERGFFSFMERYHFVRTNETATGGRQYAIRAWTLVFETTPPLKDEKWFNITYTPYQMAELEGDFGKCLHPSKTSEELPRPERIQ